MSVSALKVGATIGILGGGQLGRMLALAAAKLGFDCAIYDPNLDTPAGRVAAFSVQGSFDDTNAIQAFAHSCDVVTYEFENVPSAAADAVERSGTPLRPGRKALEVSQDRIIEKKFLNAQAIRTVDFREVNELADISTGLKAFGGEGILKTRRFGYDGKGQARIRSGDDLEKAWIQLGQSPAILETFAPFARELSIVAARSADGATRSFSLTENEHRHHILHKSTAPADALPKLRAEAEAMVERLLVSLDYIGVLALELFELPDGRLLANEMAPRVHNSGHWTMDACPTSQFEQHIRAIAGWPLGDVAPFAKAEMTNLIGDAAHEAASLAADPAVRLHMYGKRSVRSGRKMGHYNRLLPLVH